MNCQIGNDSLVFSEIQQQNLLQDSSLMNQTLSYHQTIRGQNNYASLDYTRYTKPMGHSQLSDSFSKFIDKQGETEKRSNIKTFKKLARDKNKFLSYDPKIQNIALKDAGKSQKINQLIHLIQSQKVQHLQQRLKSFAQELAQVADQLFNQKKQLQKQLQNLIQFNKRTTAKLVQIEKLLQLKNSACQCRKVYSFSKASTPINSLQRFQFAKTMINSIEELELKKVEGQEDNMTQKPVVELLWILKNKAEGSALDISEGLLNRLASGPTLKSWISIIDQKLTSIPKVSEFRVDQNNIKSDNVINQFVDVLKDNQNTFINRIKNSKDPFRQLQVLQYSTFMTFLQILREQIKSTSKQEVLANFGQVSRCLKIIERKSQLDSSLIGGSTHNLVKQINLLIQNIC